MKGDYSKLTRKWLENSSKFELDGFALKGMKINRIEVGFLSVHFVVPDHLSDGNGNWNVGAMAVLIDDLAASAVFSTSGAHVSTISCTTSFYSTAKVYEEVEIEGSVVGEKDNIVSVVVDIKKKENGEKVAVGKLWMYTSPNYRAQAAASKL